MANDETLAALERAAAQLDQRALWNDFPAARKQAAQDAAVVRAHIETLRNGGERAQIVAWLRAQAGPTHENGRELYIEECGFMPEDIVGFADAIEAGAHVGGQ